MDEKIAKIKEYLKIINKDVDKLDDELIDFVIGETLDRLQFYLNSETIPARIERILANVVNTGLIKVKNTMESEDGIDQVVTSISDNGQSISYANDVRKYFTTTSDEELFGGVATLLSRYRRVKVVYPKNNE